VEQAFRELDAISVSRPAVSKHSLALHWVLGR